jgi:hypothetical protein
MCTFTAMMMVMVITGLLFVSEVAAVHGAAGTGVTCTHLRQVQVDFITIKVRIERGAVSVVHPDGALTL